MTAVRRPALALAGLLLAACTATPPPPPLAVGATADPQSQVLAHLYAAALREAGSPARVETTDEPIAGLDAGVIGVLPGFTGRLLAVFAPAAAAGPARTDWQVYRAMVGALPEGIAAGDYAPAATDKPALAVSRATAAGWGRSRLVTLARHCAGLTVGARTGADVPGEVLGCRPAPPRRFADDAALFAALSAGRVGAAWTSTADPDVPADAVLLRDGRPTVLRAENVVPLYRRNTLAEPQVLALNQVAGVLDTAALAAITRRVAAGANPAAVADDWLADHPLGR